MKGAYNGENIVKAIILVLKMYNLTLYLRYFITDNAGNNNIIIYSIL